VRTAGLGGALLLTAAALSGCGSGSGSRGSGVGGGSASSTAPPPATTSLTATGKLTAHPPHHRGHAKPRPRPRPSRPKGPPVGRSQQVVSGGSHLTVTVTHVIDPLTGTDSPGLPATRQVGVEIEIDNHGPATYDSTASGDVSLVLSSGQAAPLDVRAGPCETQLVDFESHVYAGVVREGCVGFTVPHHARVLAARFSPYSHAPGTLTWRTAR
jgi:hypothetical protein